MFDPKSDRKAVISVRDKRSYRFGDGLEYISTVAGIGAAGAYSFVTIDH